MERRSLAAVAVAALLVSAVAWVLLSDSQGDDSYDRLARTWVEGEDPELAESPSATEVVAEDDSAAERKSADDPQPDEPETESEAEAEPVLTRLDAPGIVFEPVEERRWADELWIEIERTPLAPAEFPILVRVTASAGDEAGRERRLVFANDGRRDGFRVDELAGDVSIVIEFIDAAPIELQYSHGEFRRRLALDLDTCQRVVSVEARFDVAAIGNALESAAQLRGADAFDYTDPLERPIWIALGEHGRASSYEAFDLRRIDEMVGRALLLGGNQLGVPVAAIRLPLVDGGDTYTNADVTLHVGRDWRAADIRPLSGWPLAALAAVRSATAPNELVPQVETLAIDLEPRQGIGRHPFTVEFEFPIEGSAPEQLEIVGYGLGVVDGAPGFVRANVPVEQRGSSGVARCTFDTVTFTSPQRFMVRIEGHQPLYFSPDELFSTTRQQLLFAPGSGGVALASFSLHRNSRGVRPPAAHHTLVWNNEVAREVDALGFAEFASDQYAGFEANDIRVVANSRATAAAAYRNLFTREVAATDAAPGVVELVIDYQRP